MTCLQTRMPTVKLGFLEDALEIRAVDPRALAPNDLTSRV
jgi:hypothetical protein